MAKKGFCNLQYPAPHIKSWVNLLRETFYSTTALAAFPDLLSIASECSFNRCSRSQAFVCHKPCPTSTAK